MIKDKYVTTTWNNRTKSFYENLGYEYSKRGDKLIVPIEHLYKGSNAKIIAICDNCYQERITGFSIYSDLCRKCTQDLLNQKHRENDFWNKLAATRNPVKPEIRKRLSEIQSKRIGPLNGNWNPNISIDDRIKGRFNNESREWAKAIKIRDNYTCQVCQKRGNGTMHSHHLMAWATHPELRYDLDNGVCLCRDCHCDFHKKRSKGKCTRSDYEEYKFYKCLKNFIISFANTPTITSFRAYPEYS